MLLSGNLIAIGYLAILVLTADEPLMRKYEETFESDSAYFTRLMSLFVLNMVSVLDDSCRLPLTNMFFHISPLGLNLGLFASSVALIFSLSVTPLFHLVVVLLVDLPPQGNVCWDMNIPVGMLGLMLSPSLAMDSMSVLSCVGAISSLDIEL